MVINDFIDAAKEGRHVVVEDPIGGSKFLDPSKKLNFFIVHNVKNEDAKEGEPEFKMDITKVKKMSIKEQNGSDILSFEDKVFIAFDKATQIVVLKRVNIITDDIANIMTNKYGKSKDRINAAKIYQCGLINLQSITPNIAAGAYPYIFSNTQFINNTYVTEVGIMYNSDVLIPRTICIDTDNTYIKTVLHCADFITKTIDSQNAAYLFNGEYIRTKESVLKLIDIDDSIFMFRDVITGENMYLTPDAAGTLILTGEASSNKFIYVNMNKDNEYLFYYMYADAEHKKEYNKDKLIEIYETILKEHGFLADSPICIINDGVDATYQSLEQLKSTFKEEDNKKDAKEEIVDADYKEVDDDEDDEDEE